MRLATSAGRAEKALGRSGQEWSALVAMGVALLGSAEGCWRDRECKPEIEISTSFR